MSDLPTIDEQVLLHKYGYYLDTVPQTEEGLAAIKGGGLSQIIHDEAVVRYQEFFERALDPLCVEMHGRPLQLGGWGPVSAFELSKPRCGEPDIYPATAEQANWPEQCRMELTTSYTPGLSFRNMPTERVVEAVNRALLNVMEDFEIGISIRQDLHPRTNITIEAANLGRSILADQYLATNRCDFSSRGRMNSSWDWEYWYFVTVRSHEDGHAWGMPHNGDPSALLYPSINRAAVARKGKMNATDKQTMRRLGYRERTSPIPGPDPPTGDNLRGEITVGGRRYQIIGVPG